MRSLVIGLVAFLLCTAAFAQDQAVQAAVDWEAGTLRIAVRRPLPASGPNKAAAFSAVAAEVERNSSQIVVDQLRALQYDSTGTIDDLLFNEPRVITALTAAASDATVTDAHSTTNLSEVEVTLELDLREALMPRLIRHDRPVHLRGSIGWTATASYTGIVIYAADRLKLHGTDQVAYLRPALYPGIYYRMEDNQGIERLMEASYVSPEFLRQWGPVYYTDDPIGAELQERIGANPLRIIAYGAFGESPTDVVISREDALQILATPGNRTLIAEGRVALVLNPGQM